MNYRSTKIRKQRNQPFPWKIKYAIYCMGLFTAIIFSSIVYFELFYSDYPTLDEDDIELDEFIEVVHAMNMRMMMLENANATIEAESQVVEEDPNIHRGVIEKGETAGTLLQDWLPMTDVNTIVTACSTVYSLQKMRAGQPFTIFRDENGFSRFEYEIDDAQKLVVCKVDNSFTAEIETIPFDIKLEKVSGEINSSLFLTMAKIGETPVLAGRLADIFGWEINFIRDIQAGDSFTVLVEKRYYNGDFKGYGKIFAAEFVNQGKKFEAFYFSDANAGTTYFNSKGESLKRAFLKAPLAYTRISSQFTLKRFHPILKTWKAHPAIDYAAPTGTPVKTVGSGKIVKMTSARGSGNYVTVEHYGGYDSSYLHLSRFAKGLRVGDRVSQGDIIGYVGSTGYSTGPHLDFRMRKNGKYINPASALSPRSEPIDKKLLPKFNAKRDEYKAYLSGGKELSEYRFEKDTLEP